MGTSSVKHSDGDLDVIVELPDHTHTKHFFDLNDWTTYIVEDQRDGRAEVQLRAELPARDAPARGHNGQRLTEATMDESLRANDEHQGFKEVGPFTTSCYGLEPTPLRSHLVDLEFALVELQDQNAGPKRAKRALNSQHQRSNRHSTMLCPGTDT